jgi:choline dehydrogenase
MLSMASRHDLDNWVELGNRGWGLDDMTQCFRNSEIYYPPDANLAAKLSGEYNSVSLRGTSGAIHVKFLLIGWLGAF